MSNRKGFTLVELLAVITILAIIITIAIPSTMSISKRLKTNLYCNKIDLINTAAELYGENRKDSFSTEIEIGGKTYSGRKIQVKDLVTTNYLKKDQSDSPYIVDPRDKTSDALYNLELVIYKKNNRIHVAFNDTVNETCNIDKNSIDFSKYIVENEEVKTNSESSVNDESTKNTTDTKNDENVKNTTDTKNEETTPTTYTESILNGADPVLKDGLIPVIIADDGTVTKADTTKQWYKYSESKWANAVILTSDGTIANDGTIKEESIESYFVWIPKYSYKLWDLGAYSSATTISSWSGLNANNVKTIQVKFGTTDTTDTTGQCKTHVTSNNNCEVGDYMTHPAFISSGTNGFWVGKFETGYKGAASTSDAQVNSKDSKKIIIKPNVYSWRYGTLYNFFMAAYNYHHSDLDSHMMKNTEWGAVAYLAYSVYGKNGNVWMNNNSQFITGCVADGETSSSYDFCDDDYTTMGDGSTTGNITGIYDMSGGAWEYVAAYSSNIYAKSGFSSSDLTNYSKYLDAYDAGSDTTTYQYRILGDATGEIGPFYILGSTYYNNWYRNYSAFVYSERPWFVRGGSCRNNSLAGILTFSRDTGSYVENTSFRIVLWT